MNIRDPDLDGFAHTHSFNTILNIVVIVMSDNDPTTTVFTTERPEKALDYAKDLSDGADNITMSYVDTTYGTSHETIKLYGGKYDLIGFLKRMVSDNDDAVAISYDAFVISYE